MAIDKTKITCPQCGNVYRVDPRIYKTKELVHCECGRSWNADAEFEEICHTELKPYYPWTMGWGVVILLLLPLVTTPICLIIASPFFSLAWTFHSSPLTILLGVISLSALIVVFMLLPGIAPSWIWIRYAVLSKKMNKKLFRLKKQCRMGSDSPLLVRNMHIFLCNLKQIGVRKEIGSMAFWIDLSLDFFLWSFTLIGIFAE
ncbi:MAG: hypothetical protein J6R64_04805 [Lentisphaeria bacterium]|nr:hypothetical protein [Lentisphaeria bacterium]